MHLKSYSGAGLQHYHKFLKMNRNITTVNYWVTLCWQTDRGSVNIMSAKNHQHVLHVPDLCTMLLVKYIVFPTFNRQVMLPFVLFVSFISFAAVIYFSRPKNCVNPIMDVQMVCFTKGRVYTGIRRQGNFHSYLK